MPDSLSRRFAREVRRFVRLAMRGAVVVAGVLAGARCARAPEDARSALQVRVDALVAAYQRESYAPGVSVAVIRGGRDTLVYRGYGLADVENQVPATPRTVYRIASLTKQFTAAAVLKLAEEKRLAMDDPIGRHLPGLPAAWRAIPIRYFLNHTSGIPSAPLLRGDGLTPDSVVALAGREPMEFAPGTRSSYNNVGYMVLGLLIEKVAEEPYRNYLASSILKPHGLASTSSCDRDDLVPHRAAGYVQRDTGVVNAPYADPGFYFAAGVLCSTVGDLAKWHQALVAGRVIGAASLARMTTPEGAAVSANYGYGVIVISLEGHRLIGHGGEVMGFRSATAYLPGDSLSVTVLTNLSTSSPGELHLDVVRAALAQPRKPNAGDPVR